MIVYKIGNKTRLNYVEVLHHVSATPPAVLYKTSEIIQCTFGMGYRSTCSLNTINKYTLIFLLILGVIP